MYNILLILALASFLILVTTLLLFSIGFIVKNKNIKRELDIKEFKANSSVYINSSISNKLDVFIQEALENYIILKVLPIKENNYINDELEITIRKDVAEIVGESISPIFLQQLSSYYNINYMDKIIANKVYNIVTNYVIQNNKMEEDIPPIMTLPDYTDMRKSADNNGIIYDRDSSF